jgi:septum formation protein
MPALLLASTSRYKRELFARLGVAFEPCAPAVDETLAAGETPLAAALRLAQAKARAVAETHPRALVLAGDQLAALADEPIGKPPDAEAARRRLAQMAGETITYYTAIALSAPALSQPVVFVDESRVRLRSLTAQEISRYIAREKPFDCAGGLKLESLGSALCERIDTHDPTALIGLPLIAVARLLREQGLALP